MLLPRVGVYLVGQQFEGMSEFSPGFARFYDVVEIAPRGSDIRARKLLPVLLYLLFDRFCFVLCLRDLTFEDDFHRSFGAHNGNFGRGPRVVEITSNMLGIHDIVGSTIRLSRDDRDLGDGRLAKGKEEFSPVLDNTPP